MGGTRIVVTTRGRVDFQPTLVNLMPEIRELVTLVCHPGELKEHKINWGGQVNEIMEYPQDITNIDAVRYWCINYFPEDYIIFMDDNLNFHVRKESELSESCKFPLHQVIPKHFTEETMLFIQLDMFSWIIEKLNSDEYGIVGFNQRSGNQRVIENEKENSRTYAFWGINKKMFSLVEHKYDVSDFTFKGDFYTFIFMLTNGFKNIVNFEYAFGKDGGANNKGGCSIYRDNDCINREAELLKEKFPDFISIREKKSKSWGNVGDTIKDVTIYWKKAYVYGLNNKINGI